MMDHILLLEFYIFLLSLSAGIIGSVLGLGGGVIIIPGLTLLFGINIRYAIGASIVAVITTSCGAASTHLRDKLTNIRLGIFLSLATTIGAVIGVYISHYLPTRILFCLFAFFLAQSAYLMWKKQSKQSNNENKKTGHPLAHRLKFNGSYPDKALGSDVAYLVEKVPQGFFYMVLAGMLSGLLGTGGGALKVLAMNNAMELPIKVSSATSNFMIGVTAAASAGAYYLHGDMIPEIVGPVALGILFGSDLGARLMRYLPSSLLRKVFTLALLLIALQMGIKGIF